jgi:hypothetical protein
MIRLLHQAEAWTKDGRAVRLEDLTPEHRRNLLAWLRRRAEGLKFSADLALCSVGGPNGDAACDAFEDACDRQFAEPASVWLEGTDLVTRLRELVDADAPHRRRVALAMPVPAGAIRRR